ncbi:hypothetical protein TPDSL_17740 [Terrisporobacter petrolearius]|uniref:DEAD/DEAH box helicase family protein n=1 Tax=Terrisporobacter petrolearius TaxID=1460447 RepID=UPI003366596A
MKQYVSNLIDISRIDKSKINFVLAGTGTGKSSWAFEYLYKQLDVNPNEILVVTSRRMAQDQQKDAYKIVKEVNQGNVNAFRNSFKSEEKLIGSTKEKALAEKNSVHIFNYNEFENNYMYDFAIRFGIKAIILDEFHALYSDKNYNSSMERILNDIPELIKLGIIVIAMTATDDDIPDENKEKFNYLLDKPFFPHKITKRFNIVTKKRYIPNIIPNLEGKTIWMTFSAKDALKYACKYPNARAVISKQSEIRTEEIDTEMTELEEYIKKYKTLPDDVDILIGTSCIREGFEFQENNEIKTNIKNVIVHSSDPVAIKQFVGRYRNNVENLYVVYDSILEVKKVNDSMTSMQRIHHEEFKQYIYGKSTHWLSYFICIVADKSMRESEGSLIKFTEEDQIEQLFIDYMYESWADKLIYTKEQRNEIANKAYELGLRKKTTRIKIDKRGREQIKPTYDKHTFQSLMTLLVDNEVEFAMHGEKFSRNNELVQQYVNDEIINKNEIRPYVITI